MKTSNMSLGERIKRTFYDKDEKTVFGRTAKSWGLIFVFYAISYALLAGFFMGMISVFLFGLIKEDVPNLTGMQSLLRSTPGVNFAPQITIYHNLMQFTAFPSSVNEPYLESVKEYFNSYQPQSTNLDCSGTVAESFPKTPCNFPLETLGPCQDPQTQLANGTPCMYIRINKIFGWVPKLANASEFPSAGIQCFGQTVFDRQNVGKVEYFPQKVSPTGIVYGPISNNFFPWINQETYQTPMVAIRFPELIRNTVALLECKVLGLEDNDSIVTFEMAVDTAKA